MKIREINAYGLMEIIFSKQFMIPEDFQSQLDEFALRIEVEPVAPSMKSLMDLTWEAVSYTNQALQI